MSNIKIKSVLYKGWKNAIEISNLDIKIIVVPEVGRILYFGFIDGSNIFYENKDLEGLLFHKGKYFTKEDKIQAPDIGGNRVLPCSEEYFHLITGSRHVPDPFINASSYEVECLNNGIIIKSPISDLLGIEIKRTITILEIGCKVNIDQELIKKQAAKNAELEKIPLTIWSLSKIKTPNSTYTPISKSSIFKDGYTISKWPDAKNYAEENTRINNHILELKSSEEFPQKIGLDSRKWVAGYLKNILFIEEFNFEEKGSYPDNGTSVTIFGNHLFTELECLSPEKQLSIGEKITYNLSWSLIKISEKEELKSILENF
jgi:hypothetical protein